jgi:hypothetical protein
LGKTVKKIVLLLMCLVLLLPIVGSAPTPFTVHGHTSAFEAITITNARTGESAIVSANDIGVYAFNLGNMEAAWSRGDTIFVNSSIASKNFTIPPVGYIMRQDLPTEKFLSNTIVTTVEVVHP